MEQKRNLKRIKVALVGQPNVGKSHLINSIAGANLHVGNFAGVTVERKEVEFIRDKYFFQLVDLPGVYSFHPYTPEEIVTKHFLLTEEYDLILNVVDSNQLEKNLILTWQLADLGKPMVIGFNMFDEVRKKGGDIDTDFFKTHLNIFAQKISAKEGFGLEELFEKMIKTFEDKPIPKVVYSEPVEEAIGELIPLTAGFKWAPRFTAIRLLEEDQQIYDEVRKSSTFIRLFPKLQQVQQFLEGELGEESKTLLFEERLALAKGVVTQSVKKGNKQESFTEKIDKILIHPVLGLPIFLGIMWLLFTTTFSLGSLPVEYIGTFFDLIGEKVVEWMGNSPIGEGIGKGVIPAVGAVVTFLPNILLLFLGLNLMEQTGYMARAAYVMDGVLKRFGLQGRSFIPLVSGFGCSVPAYLSARTLKNPKDRLITMLIIGFMSCGARLPVYVLIVSAFFPPTLQGNVMFGIYIGGALIGLVVAKILRSFFFKGEPEPFVMELPKYRFPKLKSILFDLWIKTKLYLKKAGLFIGIASLVIWVLSSYPRERIVEKYRPLLQELQTQTLQLPSKNLQSNSLQSQLEQIEREMEREILENSYLARLGKLMEPLLQPVGFSWKESIALLAGLSAKEVVVSTMTLLYRTNGTGDRSLQEEIRKAISFPTAISLIIFIMFYSPCLAAMATFWSEISQWKWRLFYTIYPNLVAYLIAVVVYRLIE